MQDLSAWQAPPSPAPRAIEGRCVRLEPLSATTHAADLFAAMAPAPQLWSWLPYGPFADLEAHRDWIAGTEGSHDPMFFALLIPEAGCWRAAGVASFLRIAPAAGSIEVGHICLAPRMQSTPAATEAMALMMAEAFSLGYRRYEWKCDAQNRASRRAAQRLGFSYEGTFRQAAVVKGRNRDTAWFSVIDGEWPALRAAFGAWLDPGNFDATGRQRIALSSLTRALVQTPDPALQA